MKTNSMTDALAARVASFKKRNVVVVGDVMLDFYIRGSAERLSPEAPVPVILERERSYVGGGATNVAMNLAALGARVTLVGVVGRDEEAKILEKLCRERGVTPRFVVDPGRPTSLKTRVTSNYHQITRIDRELARDIPSPVEAKLKAALRKVSRVDAVVVSDYAKGVVTKQTIDFLKRHFGADRVIVGVKPANASRCHGVGVVVLNLKEGEDLTGIRGESTKDASRAIQKLASLFRSSVVLTRGEYGMTIYERGAKGKAHVPAKASHVYDVTGAGDTALAAIALMRASGASLADAAAIGNVAGGIAVGIAGVAVVTPKMLLARWADLHAADLKREL